MSRTLRLFALLWMVPLGACAAALGAPPAATAPGVSAGPLAPLLDPVFADTALDHAHWGVLVRSREGEVLYARNADRLFLPASNMKLVTGALALEALGPEHRFRTEFWAAGPVRNGTLHGPLLVRGAGDPTLSTRFGAADPRATLRAWADSLRAHGVTRIAGPIVGIDSAFVDAPVGAGWAWDDLQSRYAAEFGALGFNEGVVTTRIYPARAAGEPAVVVLDPPTQYVPVLNRTLTVPAGGPTRIAVNREPTGPGLEVSGEIALDTTALERTLAVRQPTLYFASVLRETLREAGIQVEGEALDADQWPVEEVPPPLAERLLFAHASPPLSEILPAMMKPSQNWIAEILLRAVGAELRGEGSARAGAAVADSMLAAWDLAPTELRIADGSGLSRYNLLSPELLVGLLDRMASSPNAALWYAALPVAGRSGTLERTFTEAPLAGQVIAKTGTLSGVRALSGYLTTGARPVVFSMLVNHHVRSSADANRVIGAALERIAAAAPGDTNIVH